MKKLFIHSCCGPCLYASYDAISASAGDARLLASFFNPNIEPGEEWLLRSSAFFDICRLLNVTAEVVPELSNNDEHEALLENRCSFCYNLRLQRSMESAKSRGFNVFTTTLLSSPTQNQGLLRRTLKHLESELSIEVYYFEVSKNEYESKVRELKNRNIYVQNYCGCYGSLCEREFDKYGLLWR